MFFIKNVLTEVISCCIMCLTINIKYLMRTGVSARRKEENMIKQEAIRKINSMGKAGVFLSRIMKILMIMSAILILGVAILFTILPKDFLTMEINGTGTMDMDISWLMERMTDEGVAETLRQIEEYNQNLEGSISVNQSGEMDIVSAEMTPDSLQFAMQGNFMHFSSREMRVTMWLMVLYLIMGIVVTSFTERLCKAFQTCETPFADDVIRWMRNTAYCLIPFAGMSSATDTFSSGIFSGSSSFSLTVNVSMILVILVILALTYVFKYGAVLQQESDETL